MKTGMEREFKRYIPQEVSDEELLNSIGSRYEISGVKTYQFFDAYFQLESVPKGYALRVREINRKLELTLKILEKRRKEGLLKRREVHTITEICRLLNLPTIENKVELVKKLQEKYGLKVILKQHRTEFSVDNVFISLDTVEYYRPQSKPIPPVQNAAGKVYKKLKLFEAEIGDEPAEKLAREIIEYLYEQGLVGEMCIFSKEELSLLL
jgi:uncharacterized protein YjbK